MTKKKERVLGRGNTFTVLDPNQPKGPRPPTPAPGQRPKSFVMVKCVACGATRKIYAGTVEADDQPMCTKCSNVMVPCFAATHGG